jgi:hypothetical protein
MYSRPYRAPKEFVFFYVPVSALIEISVKEFRDLSLDIGASLQSNNNEVKNYLFYTIQITTFKFNKEDILEGAGIKEDFKFYNNNTKKI